MGNPQFRTAAGNNTLKLHLGGNTLDTQNHKRQYIHHFKTGTRLLSIMILQILQKCSKVEFTQF